MDGSRLLVLSTTQLWHTDAVRGPSIPSSPVMTVFLEIRPFFVMAGLDPAIQFWRGASPLSSRPDLLDPGAHAGTMPQTLEASLSVLDLDRLRAAPLCRDPFDFVVVDGFLRGDAVAPLVADFPKICRHGSFPLDGVEYGPAFAGLAAALTGPELRSAIEDKFGLDLT